MSSGNTLVDPAAKFVSKLLGSKKFIALKDIEFFLSPENQQDLESSQQILEDLKKKIIISGLATLSFAIVSNMLLVKKLVSVKEVSVGALFIFDLTFYSSAAFLFMNYTAQNMLDTDSDLWKLKTNLILNHNKKYLAHLRQNSLSYKFSLEEQTQGRNLSFLQVEEIAKKIGSLRFDRSGKMIQEL